MSNTLADTLSALERAITCDRKDDEIETISVGGLRQILAALREREGLGAALEEVIRWFEKWEGKTANQEDAISRARQALSGGGDA